VEVRTAIVNAVSSLLARLDDLRHSVLAMAPEPIAAAPVVAIACSNVDGLVSDTDGGDGSDSVVGKSDGDGDETHKGEEGAENFCVGHEVSFYHNRSPRAETYSW
jgi:hypothetical protein